MTEDNWKKGVRKIVFPHPKMATHRIIQCSTDVSPIKRWVEGQILPELPLQLVQVHITGVAEPAAETV